MLSRTLPPHLTQDDVTLLQTARHPDPFSVLGITKVKGKSYFTAVLPAATSLSAKFGRKTVEIPSVEAGLFAGPVPNSKFTPELTATYPGGTHSYADPYLMGPVLGEMDVHLLAEGTHRRLWDALGAHVMEHEGVAGTHFAVWAPNAARVSVVGDFCSWDGRRFPMRSLGSSGVWEIFLPGIGDGDFYKYEIAPNEGGTHTKADPVGFGSQHPPETASVVLDISGDGWKDADWLEY
ncbi:MAG: 1,4-alpha-glucan branching enzyme, partial [Pseudomonadota bacterium]